MNLLVQHEELIEDWSDLTVLEAENRGLALKNRLVGDAEMYKALHDRESLRAADGVKYFRDTLRPHLIKGAQSMFLWRFYQFTRARRGNVEMGQVDWTVVIALETQKVYLDGHVADVRPERRANIKPVSENAERQTSSETALDPNAPPTRERWNAAQVTTKGFFHSVIT